MRTLVFQLPHDRAHNVQMGITAFLWRLPEVESGLAIGPGGFLRAYIVGGEGRQRVALRWGFEPAWLTAGRLQAAGHAPWPWVAVERAAASRVFAHPLRYQRCLVPVDAAFVNGTWLGAEGSDTLFVGGLWDHGTVALLTTVSVPSWAARLGPRMPLVIAPCHYESWLDQDLTALSQLLPILQAPRADFVPVAARPVDPDHLPAGSL